MNPVTPVEGSKGPVLWCRAAGLVRSFLEKTFWIQSTVLQVIAARKPTRLKESSVAEQSTNPETTGTRVRLSFKDVRSPSMSQASTTVKKGAEALTVSTKLTCAPKGGGP